MVVLDNDWRMARKLAVGVSLLLALSSTAAYADEWGHLPDKLGAGGKLGMNIATLGGEDTSNETASFSNRIGLAVGGFAFLPVHEWVAIQAELLFMSKGGDIEVSGVEIGTYKLDYLEFPLLARIRIPGYKRLSPYALVGPEVSIFLRAKVEDDQGNSTGGGDMVKRLEAGAVVGVGTSLAITPTHLLSFELRYDLGLMTIDDSGDDLDIKNRALTFMLGYQWGGSEPEYGSRGEERAEPLPQEEEVDPLQPQGEGTPAQQEML